MGISEDFEELLDNLQPANSETISLRPTVENGPSPSTQDIVKKLVEELSKYQMWCLNVATRMHRCNVALDEKGVRYASQQNFIFLL